MTIPSANPGRERARSDTGSGRRTMSRAAVGNEPWATLPRGAALWLVAGVFFLLLFAAAAPSPRYGVYQGQWRFSAATLTAVFAAYALLLLLTLLVFGSVSDYVGRRRVIRASLAMAAGACGLFLTAEANVVPGLNTAPIPWPAGHGRSAMQDDRARRPGPARHTPDGHDRTAAENPSGKHGRRAAGQQDRLNAEATSRERQVGPVDLSRQQIIQMLRRAGLADVAAAAQKSLPDPVDSKALDHFCATYGLSKQSLIDRMGGSP